MILTQKRFDRERLRKERSSNLQRMMREKSLDAVVATTFDTVRYMTDCRYVPLPDNFIDTYAAVLPVDDIPILFAPFVEGSAMGFAEVSPPIYVPAPIAARRWACLFADTLRRLGKDRGRIGFDYFPHTLHQSLTEKIPQATLVSALDELLRARAVKTGDEITLLRRSAAILDEGISAGLDYAKPGLSEYEVMAKMESSMMEAGAESLPWLNLRSGKRTLSSIFSNGRRLRRGDTIVFDIGAMYEGYYADAARTGCVGKPSRELQDLYNALEGAYLEGVEKIRPGVLGSVIDKTIRDGLRRRGCPDYPTPSGHGIGMRVSEFPLIARMQEAGDLDMELRSAMVLCVEPRTYKNKVAAVGIEDMILVTEDGHEILTKSRRTLDS